MSDVGKWDPGSVAATHHALDTLILGELFGCLLGLAMCRVLLLLLSVELLGDVHEDLLKGRQDL
jgi:hypothetical protein